MPCHPCGEELNAEQHWSPNPPYVQDAQFRPVSLDQLLSSRCTKLVEAAEWKVAGVKLLMMTNVCLTLHAPLCNTHEISSACNFGHRPVAMWAAPSAPRSLVLHGQYREKTSRDDFMPCHPRGAQLNAEQQWQHNPPYVQNA